MAPETYDAMLMIEDDAERQGYLLDLKDSARRVKFGVNAVNERIRMARQRYQAAQRGAGSRSSGRDSGSWMRRHWRRGTCCATPADATAGA